MYDEVVGKVLDFLNEKRQFLERYPKFSSSGYKPYKIDIKNFHEIKELDSTKKMAFIDAGNCKIIGSANFYLGLIRAAYVIYSNSKKIKFEKFDFFVFIQAIGESEDIFYKTTFFNLKDSINLKEIVFDSFDPSLMSGINRAEISNVANAIRRLCELKIAKFMSDQRLCDTIILDGNLQCTYTGEKELLDELYQSCDENGIVISALCKTTSIFMDNGNLLSAALWNIKNKGSWFYYPIVEINNPSHRAEMFFVRFKETSNHVFRFEIFNKQKAKSEETIKAISFYCKDPVFIGYPYGLVEADKIARVSNQEREFLKTIFMTKLKNKNLQNFINSSNAHEILDSISF